MRRWEAVDWWILVFGPLAFVLLTIPLLAALDVVTRPRPEPAAAAPAWIDTRARVDQALAGRNTGEAIRAWHDAHAAALATQQWDAMLGAGDLALRIGEANSMRGPATARARESYLIALFRARRDGSLEGVLRAAEAFESLGDADIVDQALRVAERLVAHGSTDARERYRQAAERLRARAVTATDAR
ncbi:MAG: hypothetical protein HYR51_13830 [Candidatus Rokubacteria bacterium]|nr:hypothetical protein [Candidatus Rokubacteria bacterium]